MLTLPAACALQARRMETLLALGAVVKGAVHGMLCRTCISAALGILAPHEVSDIFDSRAQDVLERKDWHREFGGDV